jgi:hypothetical protein
MLLDRAQGGSSLKSGQLELMLLRETIRDDGRGVDEPLNDPGQFGKGLIVKGKHFLHFTPPNHLDKNELRQRQLTGLSKLEFQITRIKFIRFRKSYFILLILDKVP